MNFDYQNIYFVKSDLTDGDHTINFVVTSNNETKQFALDYIRIVPDISEPNPYISAPQNSAPSNSAPSSTVTSSGLSIAARHSTPVGAIVGGVVGGVAVLVIALCFLMWKQNTNKNLGQGSGTLY